jgi:threonine 3-dehydrogenase
MSTAVACASTMLAIKKTVDGPGLTWSPKTEKPTIESRDVLIQVTHAGICGTDRHIYEWDSWSRSRIPIGITTGHEFVGRIVEKGSAVNQYRVGQRVCAEGHIGCGFCEQCRTGNAHICDGVDIIGIDRDGCFAQFVSMPEENIWPIHDDIPDAIAAIFDPLGNAVHTVMSADVSGKSVLITGVGTIGLMAVTVAKAAGASSIFVSDINPQRLALAKKLGANEAFSAKEDWVDSVRSLTHGQGPQVLLEMSGNAKGIRQGFAALRNGGTAALLGIPGEEISINLAKDVIFKGAKILGINGRKMFETWYQMESLVLSGRLQLDPIITHQIPFEDFDRGFKMMQSGEAIKVVLKIPKE